MKVICRDITCEWNVCSHRKIHEHHLDCIVEYALFPDGQNHGDCECVSIAEIRKNKLEKINKIYEINL